MCLRVPKAKDLVLPLETILLLERRHPFLPSPSTTSTWDHGHGEAIWVCPDGDMLTSVILTNSSLV
jgi:hypothetical protein